MKELFIVFFFAVSFLISCGRVSRLSENDYKWMPYKGNETLVFKSNTGESDTIFFIRKDTLWGYPDPALSTSRYEEVAIFCKHHSSNKLEYGRSYYFFKIQKAKDNRAELVFDLSTDGAVFYRLRTVKIDSLRKENHMTLQTSDGKYDDVYVIYPDDYARDFYHRSNYVTKLYWSKSNGLIRYDKKDTIYWELEKKY